MADFNPGITGTGLFWTQPLSWGSGHLAPGAGEGDLSVSDLPMPDFGNIGNALFGSPIADGLVSVNVDWGGPTERHRVTNEEQGWDGQFFNCQGEVSWSAERTSGDQPFSFHTTTQEEGVGDLFFVLAHERNGVFFAG